MKNKSNSIRYLVRFILPIVYLIVIFAGLFSCDDTNDSGFKQSGTLILSLEADTAYRKSTTTKSVSTEFSDFLNVNDYTVKIMQGEELFRSYDKYADMPDEIEIPSGAYTMQAYKGENKAGAFLNPYFEGSQEFTIEEDMRTPISTTCTLANTRVSVSYTEDFLESYPSHAVHFNTAFMNTDTLTFTKGEDRAAYFRSDKTGTELNILLELVKLEETKINYYKPAPISIEPQQNVNLLFKTDGEAINGIGLVVTLNNNWEDSVTFNMTIPEYAWGDVTLPTLGKDNFEKTIEHVSYSELQKTNDSYYLDYIIPAAVGKTALTISRTEDGNTTNTTYDLATTEGANAARMLGITISDQANDKTFTTTKESKYGRIHFTGALALLPPSKKSVVYTYTVQFTDALPVNPNSTETTSLVVKPDAAGDSKLTGTNAVNQKIPATESLPANIVVDYETDAGIKTTDIEIKRNGEIAYFYNLLTDVLPEGITFDGEQLVIDKAFVGSLEVSPGANEEYTFTVNAIDRVNEAFISSPMEFTVTLEPVIEITIPKEHLWAWKAKAVIHIPGFGEQHKTDLKVYIAPKGGQYIELSDISVNGSNSIVTIPNLVVGSEYELKTTFKGIEETASFKTEDNIQVENSAMNTWYLGLTACKAMSFLTVNIPFAYLNDSAEDKYWKTNNSVTAGQGYSAAKTNDIYVGCFPTVAFEYRDATDVFAAVVRSIDASAKNGKARGELVYENAITSRPYSINFEYVYESINSENFVSDVIVYAGEKEIGRGSRPASAKANTAYEKCTIPIVYSETGLKATRIKLFFASTDKATDFAIETGKTVRGPDPGSKAALVASPGKFKNFNSGVSRGSTLKIDNVILNYAE